jgi:uncharacterized protein YprB with RNaseH-like and TPR domain
MDLKLKLNMYLNNQEQKAPSNKKGLDISDVIEGKVCSNEDGSFFLIEEKYPVSYIHGGYNLEEVRNIDFQAMARVFKGTEPKGTIEDYLFLDTETTGLSGGTGTVAFLVGVGFFKEDTFILQQYYMRDYDEEPAMLTGLNRLLSGFKGLVTFNGKGFDWSLLTTRYTFNRIKMLMKNPIHMDLLYPSRRIWKLKLESCRLSSLEENVLGEFRIDDIPGALIPGIYFKYLEDRDATEIKRVIAHNKLDILSMVSLLTKISYLMKSPLKESDGGHELYGIGRIYETSGSKDTVINCYEACMKSGNSYVSNTAVKRLIDICKRNGDYERLVKYCMFVLSSTGFNRIPVMIELAKYYEHKARDFEKAMKIAGMANNELRSIGIRNEIYDSDLKKRIERLERKIRYASGKAPCSAD